jgi:Sporulation protein and related proteins
MKERINKILVASFMLIALMLFSISSVFAYSYEFVNPDNEYPVKRERKYIYILADLYYDVVGRSSSSFSLMNYSGICNTVTIESGPNAGSYPLEEYIAGVVKQEIGGTGFEAQKAQAVAARSYLIGQMESKGSCNIVNSQSFQTFSKVDPNNASDQQFIKAAQETAGMVIMHEGKVFITYYSSSPANSAHNVSGAQWHITLRKDATQATEWTWVGPPKSEVCNYAYCGMDGRGHSWGMSQILASYLASKEGYTYEEILELFYKFDDKYDIGVLSDGDYVGDLKFEDSSFGKIHYFNQGSYRDYYYSSDVKVRQYTGSSGNAATIASHGCGPTAMSIVLSSFENRTISPITTTERVCALNGCTNGGTYFSALATLAKEYGYKAEIIDRSARAKVITALESGNALVVARMGPGTFTKGGHYIVLTGTRSDGYISVADPGSNARTETKWFSANLIFEEVQNPSSFMIVTR